VGSFWLFHAALLRDWVVFRPEALKQSGVVFFDYYHPNQSRCSASRPKRHIVLEEKVFYLFQLTYWVLK